MREFLNDGGQCVEVLPEPPVRSANHGRSCRRPARMSARTFSATECSRPSSVKSLSIWRSQAALSRSRIKVASSVSSSAERVSTAVFISARLTVEVYRERDENAILREIFQRIKKRSHSSQGSSKSKLDATSRCSPLKPGLGQINIALDAAQDFVVDGLLVAQGDDGVALRFQGFPR